jgi:hypothetical protein
VVIDKQAPIENRISPLDVLLGSSITKSMTVYYIIAEDGTICEVDMGTYSKAKISDYLLCNWKKS